MDEEPFAELNLTKLSKEDIIELEMFTKEKYNSENIIKYVEEKKLNNKIKKILEKEFNTPSKEFVKLISKKVDKGPLTKIKLRKFRKIIKNNINLIMEKEIKDEAEIKFKGFTEEEKEDFKNKYNSLPEKFKDNELIRNNTIVKLAKSEEVPENSLYGNDNSDFKLVDNILTKYFIKTNDYADDFVKLGIFKANDKNIKKKTKLRFIKYLNGKDLDTKEEKKILDKIFSE